MQTFLNMARNRPSMRGLVALNNILRVTVKMLQYSYRSHGIALVLDLVLAEALPGVTADGDQIGQVVMDLLINAQQAPAGAQDERRVRVQPGLESRRND
ncbi:MAG: hypothetical protein H7337_22765 [Rhizobacter sp.]|nr:hypothetical protein [Rhizobacter sp.]